MFNWAKQQMANVAGTQEPIYGPTAIQSVLDQAKETPYTELKKEHMKWRALNKTNVETQCFYFQTNEGKTAMAQVIYSNVAGIRTTVQFNSKIFNHADGKEPNLWCSDPLENVKFDNDKYSISATNCSVELSEDGSTYTIKSSTSKKNIVELKVKRTAPGFMVGKDGTSYYGTDPQQPWGEMHHRFWPRCEVEGTMMTQAGQVNCAGRGMFVHALQGMKPHHAAARWNFVDFQSPTYSAVMMEFTTPPSYGTTVVTVGGIATDGKLLYAGPGCTAKHTEVKADAENEWPEPSATSYHWEGQKFSADLGGSLEKRIDRIDVMAEVPGFVKAIVASAAGTKPYIYQYIPKMTLKIKEGGEEKSEEGVLFTEATFIS